MRYLCPQHRQWLINNPEQAITHVHKSHDNAHYFREQDQLAEAVMHAGNAYETAEIVLNHHIQAVNLCVLSFTSNAILLASLQSKFADKASGLEILSIAKQRLEAESTLHFLDHKALLCIKSCISSLQDGMYFYGLTISNNHSNVAASSPITHVH